ncbi:hypothetical protein EXW94_18115 [Enterobacter sp. JMULE2]|uniref:hypothetical protein n=1 Tax=Enterobacter sp. JMULE2 TaxID=2518340 RepID=UPI0015757EB5|nr:hypothetical protein [Enterobacter sp. JMULE2]NTZ36177.1 hypothetical protein [Enterobacter sp. JMULE2]NTZ39582.1 hypothetical protein [Enterobacter sp. JMULE2]
MKSADSVTQQIDSQIVIEKLKSSGANWSYLKIAQPHQDGANFEFIKLFEEEIEYALYERQGLYFVLIDFFKSYEEAGEYAKKIINSKSSLKSIFSAFITITS